jgi:acyl-CoA synthetase (AMP-forming)/AMP-acid ligase II
LSSNRSPVVRFTQAVESAFLALVCTDVSVEHSALHMPDPSSLLAAWNRTVRSGPAERVLVDASSGRTWSRAELDAAADKWCEQHAASASQRTVAIAEPNGAEWLSLLLALLKCDAVIAPLDPGDPIDVQRTIARSIRADFLWRAGSLEAMAPSWRPIRDGRRFIKLTSGSTGTPRALYFRDPELMADGRQLCAAMGITPSDLNLGLIPWGHSYGLGNLVMPLMMQGTAILYGAPPLPHAVAKAIDDWKPTVFPAVPALLRALAESEVPAERLASLRTVISAGAPLAAHVAQNFHARFRRKIHSFYGSSETGGISYDATGDSAALGRGVGTPIAGVKVEFKRGGRFTVTSDAVFTIANRRPGSHLMADVARFDESSELVLVGRAGRFVKIAGRRLNLAEVEHALKRVDGVSDAFVTSHADRADALAAAVVTLRTSDELRHELRARLAPWKLPKKILTMTTFPLTERGKTDTRQLRTLLGH